MTGELKTAAPAPRHIVVMGVTSCGKSTVGAAIAERIGAKFVDGDSLHPQSNIDKMASGIPLNDADRAPWLAQIGRRFAASDTGLVIACSALKRDYRDIIRSGDPSVVFVHLHGTRDLLAGRMAARPGHFMPLSLLDSQLETLEALQPDEAGVMMNIATPVGQIVDEAVAAGVQGTFNENVVGGSFDTRL
ncbi:gluconokinase [Arthrobacter globiformis]|uniref:gluconokinase n=1 Tax=Arthrobacter globiformis TaxID=1665 RepID=UPI00278A505A|nr:gluconokinase [Arthrobacter globiformis]MDQ0864682.1 carbohydrate kinase (thermoresistant glucokinase family) [Arthrobacter globiformis]